MQHRIIAVLTALCALIGPPTASAAETPDQILGDLAANQTHSWVDDNIGMAAMAAKYRAGGRLYVTCGNVAELARQLLAGAGYPARVVQTMTRGEYDYIGDGHLMTEVFYEGDWQLYDVDANRRAVDQNGSGVSVVEQVEAVRVGSARWELIAGDPLLREDETSEYALQSWSDMEAFYRHVMGVALLPEDPHGRVGIMYFHDTDQAARLQGYSVGGTRILASPETWESLTSAPIPTTGAPTTPATGEATTSVTPAQVIHVRAARPCARLKRRYHRARTRRTYRRYLRCRAPRARRSSNMRPLTERSDASPREPYAGQQRNPAGLRKRNLDELAFG